MVHALYEVYRVLKPNGILIDLRPAAKHRRVGLGEGKKWRLVGAMRERFDDDRAANKAVGHVLREGKFRRELRVEFDVDRVMDTTDDFRAWLDEFVQAEKLPSHQWLIERVDRARMEHPPRTKITVRGPLLMQVLRTADAK